MKSTHNILGQLADYVIVNQPANAIWRTELLFSHWKEYTPQFSDMTFAIKAEFERLSP